MSKDPVRKLIYHINKPRIKALNKIADFIITLTKDKTLFEKPAVFMTNGFDARRISVIDPHVTADPFVIIGVASDCAHYHGYDKVILGLAAYYRSNPKRKIYFRIISSLLGYNITALKKLVDENNLNPYVEFCGSMDREELEKEFKKAHVGMGTLALHRVGLMHNYSLKHREYAAFGLPFVISKGDDVFENSEFVFTVERDELPLDISEILSFYDELLTLYPDYPKAFRRFAEEKISWDSQLENVFRVISTHDSGNKITCA
jgi:glycosyltransferase involved in cell wall biosynthesis